MTQEVSHGAATREPVYSGTRRVRGLWQRTLADGSTVYEARLRIDGRDCTVVARRDDEDATRSASSRRCGSTAIAASIATGRSRPTLAELAAEWLEHLQSRVGIRDERRRYSQRTVDLYRQRLDAHVLDRLGSRRVDELTVDDVRRLVDGSVAAGSRPARSRRA